MSPSQDKMMPAPLLNVIHELQRICDARGSTSAYFEYGSSDYKNSIRHYLMSSSEVAQLAVQPGSPKDLGAMMKVLKEYQVQFAVKCGGHGMAPTVSSTTGIQISMSRFSKVLYDSKTQLVEIGAGCLWDQVYSKLAPSGRNVIGGASSDGVGVGGWLLGGGYSLKSNRYGLGIDHIVEYEIVTPDGRIRTVTAQKERDLFQALRGGGNNFGIVTKFVLKTYSQNPTYGAYLLVPGKQSEEVKNALVDFVDNEHRQEACAIAAFRHKLVRGEVEFTISIICIFDAAKPKRKNDVPFQEFKSLTKSGEVWKADPAGWQLGQTELSTSDGSVKRVPAMSTRPKSKAAKPKDKPILTSKNPKITHKSAKYEDEDEDEDADKDEEGSSQGDDDLIKDSDSDDDDYNSEDYDDFFDDILEEMAYNYEWHGALPIPLPRLSSNSSKSRQESQGTKRDSSRRTSKYKQYDTDDASSSGSDDYSDSDYSSSDDYYSDDNDSTLYDSDSEGERRFTKKSYRQRGSSSKKPNLPPRILVTKKPDVMGELQERGRFGCLMVSKYTKPLLDKMEEEAEKCARYLKTKRGLSVIIDAWPVHASIFDNSPQARHIPINAVTLTALCSFISAGKTRKMTSFGSQRSREL
ncbi:hypothetical protein BDZ94DRAFT_1253281 [Collybia nuda]|uniref:FAD-binding PCMH-type domain-containing protein n=1 Tax=Collybia nuda TaxID=64659 RepID=A0A9P5YDE2_9AGAR|nr:hypothetical protein BDZ94DRAFT_1253281 [Collybia nuda]